MAKTKSRDSMAFLFDLDGTLIDSSTRTTGFPYE